MDHLLNTTVFNHKSNFVSIIVHEAWHYMDDYIEVKSRGIDYIAKYKMVGDVGNVRHLMGAYLFQIRDESFQYITPHMKNDIRCNVNNMIGEIQNSGKKAQLTTFFDQFFD
jgi:hypothetical protein